MPPALRSYAHLEDAWADGLETWCREATEAALTKGTRSWLVCATRGQSAWVKARLLRAGVPLIGLHFLQTSSFRRELCLRLGEPLPGSEHEALILVVRSLAGSAPKDRQCVAIVQQPAEWLRALEDLDAAGWLEDASEFARFVPKPLRSFAKRLRLEASEWLGGVDRRLRERASAAPKRADLSVAVLDWEASCFGHTDLLAAAIATSASAACFAPLPRFANEEVQQGWLDWVSETFSTTDDPCAGLTETRYGSLTDRLEGVDLATMPVEVPGLLVGKTWSDQIELITREVAHWLVEHRADHAHRLVVVLPTRNATSVALGRRLAELSITHENTIGERPEPAWEARALRALVEYYREGCSAAAFLRLLAVRAEGVDDSWREEAADRLPRAFDRVQSGLAKHVAVNPPFADVVAELADWQRDASVSVRREAFVRSIRALRLPTPVVEQIHRLLDPIWPSLEQWFRPDQLIAGAHWLDFLNEALNSIPTAQASGEANARNSRVVLATLADAATQTWQGVILADANDEIWPFPLSENSLLPDQVRSTLNARRKEGQPLLLTASDRAAIDEARFLTLLENCDGPFWFAASGVLAESPHRTAHPNEWALRCLIASTPNAMDAWNNALRRTSRKLASLETDEARHLVAVRNSRHDPRVPFDEYFLRFGPISNAPQSLRSFAARTLERLISEPAELAYKLVFDATSQRDAESLFRREERKIVGTIAHRWMHRLLAPKGDSDRRLNKSLLHDALLHGIAAQRENSEHELSLQLHQASNVAPTAWWKSVFGQAERVARRWTSALLASPLPDGSFRIATERAFEAALPVTNSRPLAIHGRLDLCLLGETETVVLDYKSGDQPRPVKPESVGVDGKHLPLVAYLWLALANGLPHPRVGLATAGGPIQAALVGERDFSRFEDLASQFARQQRESLFGQVGPLVAGLDGHCETLPIATIPVSVTVLALKALASGLGATTGKSEDESDE